MHRSEHLPNPKRKIGANSIKLFAAGLPTAISSMAVDFASPQPIYKQLCQMFRAAITAGDLPPGVLLPTTYEIASALGVGRNTVVTVYSQLAAEGYVESNTRRGTRVSGNPPPRAPLAAQNTRFVAKPAQENGVRVELSFRAQNLLRSDHAEACAADVQMPDPSLYPRVQLSRLIYDEFYKTPCSDPADGLHNFQTSIVSLLRHHRGVQCSAEQVIPVPSLKHALDITLRALVDPGNCVYVEDPTDPGVWASCRAAGANVLPVPSDAHGADTSQVRGPPPRLIYVTPSLGFPLGRQMSEDRRAAVLDAAYRANAIIFECDRWWEFSYSERRLQAVCANDQNGRVLYFGTLCGTLGPQLRPAYLVVPPPLVDCFMRLSRQLDCGPAPFILGALGKFLTDVSFVTHLKAVRQEYCCRLTKLLDACKRHLANAATLEPIGGFTLALRGPEDMDDVAISALGSRLNVALAPLSLFYHGKLAATPKGVVVGLGSVHDRVLEALMSGLVQVLHSSSSPSSSQN